MKTVKPLARTTGIIVQQQNDEYLLFDLGTNQAFCLNPTSAYVWNQCNGKNSISDIRVLVESKFQGNVSADFIDLSLKLLLKHNLLANAQEVEPIVAGINRRELLRNVAFGSAIALPLVSTIIAPTAASAQSGTGHCSAGNGPCSPIGSPCTGTDFCDTGTSTCIFGSTPCATDADCPPANGTCNP
ncbi:MAG: PqqD family peptide modification chaperone [Pyrinomonadaceae bacterium]